jgi:hypothetical protein
MDVNKVSTLSDASFASLDAAAARSFAEVTLVPDAVLVEAALVEAAAVVEAATVVEVAPVPGEEAAVPVAFTKSSIYAHIFYFT